MTPALAPAPTTLAERARAAAERRATHPDPAWDNPHWLRAAHTAARHLADILAIAPCQISLRPSTLRRNNDWPWPELTVADAEDRFRFVAAYCDPNQLTALEACPFCEAEVPTFPMRTLADLGDLLDGGSQDEPVDAFDQDPGHKSDCLHAASTF